MKKHLLLQTSPLHLERIFEVAAFIIDQNKQMSLPGLIAQLQEVALESTRQLGVSVFDLEPHDLGWVLLGQRIEINRLPKLAEACTVITAPTGFERVFTFRDFHLLDSNGQIMATATTTWMLMNTQTRKMAKFPDWIKKLDKDSPLPDARLPRAEYKLVKPSNSEWEKQYEVGFHDLDFNGHLTNAIYVRWMLDALPIEVLMYSNLQQLKVQFAKEARYGNKLRAVVQKTDRDGVFHHGLFLGQECLASMQTYFAAR